MIKINLVPQMNNRLSIILIFLFFLSCSSTKTFNGKSMGNALDDYIKTYQGHNFEDKLDMIMISTKLENGKMKYIINDAPRKLFLGDLNKFSQNKKVNVFMGSYKNYLCEIQSDSLQNYKHFFTELDESIVKEAQQAQTVQTNDGKNYNIDNSLLNWTPKLTIVYNVTEGTKKIIVEK